MIVLRLPSWGLSYTEARYYSWRHSVHIGPWLIFWGRMTDREITEWEDQQ